MGIGTTQLLASNIFNLNIGCSFALLNSISVTTEKHSHDFYEFFIVVEGIVIHKINDQIQYLKAGNMLFIRPTDIHYYQKHDEFDFKFYNFAFSKEVYELLLDFMELKEEFNLLDIPETTPLAFLSSRQLTNIISEFDLLNHTEILTLQSTRILYRKVLASIFQAYYNAINKVTDSKAPRWLEDLCLIMNEKDSFTTNVSSIIAKTGRTHEHVCREFKKYVGMSPSVYLNSIRLNYSKNLLINTDIPILDIAMDSGFENLSHFYHLFKRTYSISPKDMRKGNKSIILP